ncbi:MAG: DUF3667 domain-containing protein [Ferruginibacter sp.]|nr:DUF3667 domain-containing protein [Cytophagales bacterium]
MTCTNCANTTAGNYCERCGQQTTLGRLTVGKLVKEAFFSVVQVDRGFLFTARELSLRPGKTVRAYAAGKRVAHYPPHKYLFVVGAAATYLTTRYHFFFSGYQPVTAFGRETNALLGVFFQYADAYTTLVNVVSIPVFALFSFLLFRPGAFNYAENLVLNAYVTSQQMLLFVGVVPVVVSFPAHRGPLLGFYAGLTLLYNGWAYLQFFQARLPNGLFRSAAAMGLAYLVQFALNLSFFYVNQSFLR